MSKLDDLYGANSFTARDAIYIATRLWETEPKLAKRVQAEIKAGKNYDPAAQKAIINEWDSAVKYFTDLSPVAQNFVLENQDTLADDLVVMIKKCAEYYKLSGNFWEYLAENYASLPRAVRKDLSERGDTTRAFKIACGEVVPRAAKVSDEAPKRKTSAADSDEAPRRSSRREKVSDEPAPRSSSRREKINSDSDKPARSSSRRSAKVSDEPAPRKSSSRREKVSDSDVPARESRRQLRRSTDSDLPTSRHSVKEVMRKTNRPGKLLK